MQPYVDPTILEREVSLTLTEPGLNGRFVFSLAVMARILAYREAIEPVVDPANRRLLRVLLGSTLVGVSNVVVNGKGRKYRNGWQQRQPSADSVDAAFDD